MAIKVTIWAFGLTERPVYINSKATIFPVLFQLKTAR
jgi:hypothetical protein